MREKLRFRSRGEISLLVMFLLPEKINLKCRQCSLNTVCESKRVQSVGPEYSKRKESLIRMSTPLFKLESGGHKH